MFRAEALFRIECKKEKDDAAAVEDPLVAAKASQCTMHKVVLAAKNENQLLKTARQLDAAKLDHFLWIEMPERMPTALATKPYPRATFAKIFRRLQLLR